MEDAGFCKKHTRNPIPKTKLIPYTKEQIIHTYNAVLRGFLNYYSFASNRGNLVSLVRYVLWLSCARTLAVKYKLKRTSKVIKRFGKNFEGNSGVSFLEVNYKRIQGGGKFSINSEPQIKSLFGDPISLGSLEGLSCTECGSRKQVEMHHIRMMKDINKNLDKFSKIMIKVNRKQIPLCRKCHMLAHKLKRPRSNR